MPKYNAGGGWGTLDFNYDQWKRLQDLENNYSDYNKKTYGGVVNRDNPTEYNKYKQEGRDYLRSKEDIYNEVASGANGGGGGNGGPNGDFGPGGGVPGWSGGNVAPPPGTPGTEVPGGGGVGTGGGALPPSLQGLQGAGASVGAVDAGSSLINIGSPSSANPNLGHRTPAVQNLQLAMKRRIY